MRDVEEETKQLSCSDLGKMTCIMHNILMAAPLLHPIARGAPEKVASQGGCSADNMSLAACNKGFRVQVLGADALLYQTLEDLLSVGQELNPAVRQFEASCFTGAQSVQPLVLPQGSTGTRSMFMGLQAQHCP